jgi:hypothetical protein
MYLYISVLVLLIIGGLISYEFNDVVITVTAMMTALYPANYSGSEVTFIGSVWYWMPLFIVFAVVIYMIVNSSREAYTR